jgi:hypothetical protein
MAGTEKSKSSLPILCVPSLSIAYVCICPTDFPENDIYRLSRIALKCTNIPAGRQLCLPSLNLGAFFAASRKKPGFPGLRYRSGPSRDARAAGRFA